MINNKDKIEEDFKNILKFAEEVSAKKINEVERTYKNQVEEQAQIITVSILTYYLGHIQLILFRAYSAHIIFSGAEGGAG